MDLEIIETSSPSIINDNHPSSLMSKSYGYGIQISPLHLTKATAIVLNGGKSVTPTLLKNKLNQNNTIQILSKETSKKIEKYTLFSSKW